MGPYSKDGYNKDGYNRDGFNKNGFNRDGFNKEGYNRTGYSKAGFNKLGYDKNGFNKDGFDTIGLDVEGYDKDGYKYGEDGKQYDREGLDRNGRDRGGLDSEGYDKDGYKVGEDRGSWDRGGYDREGRDRKGRSKEENENAAWENGRKEIHGKNLTFDQEELENSEGVGNKKNPKPIDESLGGDGGKDLEDDQRFGDVEEAPEPREKKTFEGDELVMKIAEAKAPVEIPDYIKNKMDFEFEEDPAEAALRKKKEVDAKKKAEKDAKRKANKEARRIEKAAAEKKAQEDAAQAKIDQQNSPELLESEKPKNAKPEETHDPKFKSSGTSPIPTDHDLALDLPNSDEQLGSGSDLTKQQSILKKDTSKAKDMNRRVSFGALEEATPQQLALEEKDEDILELHKLESLTLGIGKLLRRAATRTPKNIDGDVYLEKKPEEEPFPNQVDYSKGVEVVQKFVQGTLVVKVIHAKGVFNRDRRGNRDEVSNPYLY